MRIAMFATNDVLFLTSNIELRVNRDVYNCWLKHRQVQSNDTEQFGVLIGSRLNDESTIWIEKCTTPRSKDTSKRARFLMQDPFHQKIIDEAFEKSNGEMGYIGTWHTHPQNIPIPSGVDLTDWLQCSLRNPDRQLVFVIVGNEQINIYININNKLEMVVRKIDG